MKDTRMLPEIQPFEDISLNDSFCLVAVAGFEDRASAIFKSLENQQFSSQLNSGVMIEYEPYDQRNDVQAVEDGMASIGVPKEELHSIVFDRRDPDLFEPKFRDIVRNLESDSVLLDISGMSKLLITLALQILAEEETSVTIFYAEAAVYHPTEEKFESEKSESESPDETPAFLTSDIYDIVTSRLFSSMAKSGQPLVTIAFPTFNYKELMALASELSPHLLISIEGEQHHPEYQWRRDAIKWLNREIESHIRMKTYESSTLEYRETIDILEEIYEEYADAYRLLLSPTGTKMQTVGSALFRRLHPDLQVVYPVTTEFSKTYTEGWRKAWGIDIGEIDATLARYHTEDDDKIAELREKVREMR